MRPVRRTALQIFAAGLALVAAAAALAAGDPSGDANPKLRLLADGSISIEDSLDGEAILTANDFFPGASTDGTVAITNTGTAPGSLSLRSAALEDTGGAGGTLSEVLDLEITDVTSGSTAIIFSGGLAEMPLQDLLVLPAGEERVYHFAVSMPDGGVPENDYSGDNRLQLATARIAYDWTLTEKGDNPALCSSEILGNNQHNRLVGTTLSDRINGLGGSDWISALAGDDCVDGGKGGDTIGAGSGDDLILGRQGRDKVRGGSGDDRIRGGSGSDRAVGGPGADAVYGGSGDDRIKVRGGGVDFVDCGSGDDQLIADRRDRTKRC